MRIDSPSITPLPLSEKAQFTAPARLAVPLTVIGTLVPLMCPAPVPLIVTPPGHVAEKLPAISVSVCVVTVHWKVPHVVGAPGSGEIACDVQLPSSDGITALGCRL